MASGRSRGDISRALDRGTRARCRALDHRDPLSTVRFRTSVSPDVPVVSPSHRASLEMTDNIIARPVASPVRNRTLAPTTIDLFSLQLHGISFGSRHPRAAASRRNATEYAGSTAASVCARTPRVRTPQTEHERARDAGCIKRTSHAAPRCRPTAETTPLPLQGRCDRTRDSRWRQNVTRIPTLPLQPRMP